MEHRIKAMLVCFALFVCASAFTGGRIGKSNSQSMYGNRYFAGQQTQQSPYHSSLNNSTQPRATRSPSFMSAWGIIIVIVLIIVLGALAYYITICYPLIFNETADYNIMDLSSSTTPARSREFEKGDYSRPETPQKQILDDVDNNQLKQNMNMNMKY